MASDFPRSPRLSRVTSLRRARRRRPAVAAAAATAAQVISRLRREQHRLALGIACLLKLFPPLREFLGRLAARAPQHVKLESGPESLVREEPEGAAPAPLLKSLPQPPPLLHHRLTAAPDEG